MFVKTKNHPLFLPIKSFIIRSIQDSIMDPNYTTLFQKSIKNNKNS